MNLNLSFTPIVSLIAGALILIVPRLLIASSIKIMPTSSCSAPLRSRTPSISLATASLTATPIARCAMSLSVAYLNSPSGAKQQQPRQLDRPKTHRRGFIGALPWRRRSLSFLALYHALTT